MPSFSSSVLVCFFYYFLLSYYLISVGDRITVLVFIYLQVYTGIVLLTLSGPKTVCTHIGSGVVTTLLQLMIEVGLRAPKFQDILILHIVNVGILRSSKHYEIVKR